MDINLTNFIPATPTGWSVSQSLSPYLPTYLHIHPSKTSTVYVEMQIINKLNSLQL